MSIILASSSAIRRDMLQEAGVECAVIPSDFDEEAVKPQIASLPYAQQGLYLAANKALAVSRKHMDAYVIGADQICADQERIYQKPGSIVQACRHLRYLQGKTHWQHSAACLFQGGHQLWSVCDIVTLTMHAMTEQEIQAYVEEDQPLQACGGYCYEKNGHRLFRHIDGSKDAIKGLPLTQLLSALRTYCTM